MRHLNHVAARPWGMHCRCAPQGHCCLLMLSVLLLLAMLSGQQVLSQSGALVKVSPENASVALGQTIDIQVMVENIANLYGIDVRVLFDPAILEVVDVNATTSGVQVTPGTFPYPDFTVKNETDNALGLVWYVVTQLNPRQPASGSGTIMTIRFRAKAP